MSRIAYAHIAPEAVKALGGMKTYFDGASIDKRLRALVELRVSQINGCVYCIDMHSREARHAGETQQRLDCLPAWREAPFYSDPEKAALAWAESVTLVADTSVPDAVFEMARTQLSETELVDLTFIVGTMNAWNRIAISFRQLPPTRGESAATGV